MKRPVPLKGIVAYPITPFTADDAVDVGRFRALLERLLQSGVHAVAPLGSTGVLPYLSDREREEIAAAAMEQVAGRVPVMIGVSSLVTGRVVHHARLAERLGAAAVMVIPMSYWKLTEAEVLAHYRAVADAISIPIMVYNNPATGGLDLAPEFLARLLQIPNVTMVKESTGDIDRLHRLVRAAGDDVAFYNGSNPLALDAFLAGATGWCTAAPNLIPRLNLDLYAAIEQGDHATARAVFHKQLPLLQLIGAGGLPRTIAAGLEVLGVDPGHLRAPLAALGDGEKERLADILRTLV